MIKKMIPAKRQKTILAQLAKQEVVSINELIEQLGVSHMTIRRDIAALEKKGKVTSVSGGVQLTQLIHHEASHDAKKTQHASKKENIGKIASELIKENDTVYLDAGTTTLEIARNIATRADLLIVTNDFVIANYLMQNGSNKIYHTGGLIDRENRSSVGSQAAKFLAGMNIDIAFLSTSSWNLKGISTPSEAKVTVKEAVAKAARNLVLVTDSSKYGKVGAFHILDLDKINIIVTDNDLPMNLHKDIQEKGITLLAS